MGPRKSLSDLRMGRNQRSRGSITETFSNATDTVRPENADTGFVYKCPVGGCEVSLGLSRKEVSVLSNMAQFQCC